MKKALFSITAAIILVGTAFSANPILRQKYTADPNPFVWKDRLYVYASYDNNNPSTSGYDIMFYTLVSTDDMANWTDHGEVFSVKRDLSAYGQAYAPGTAVKDNKVYLYIPNGGSGIGVASADRPEGPWSGGKSFISKSDQNNTNVPWLFDPAGFVDSDGQGYIYFGGGDTQAGSNLRVAKLNSDMMSAQFPAKTIEGSERSFEAAYMHKNGDNYYFSYSQNFTNGSANIAYMMGKNPMGPFTFMGTMLPNSASGGGNNHAGVVQYKNNWYIFYHDRKLRQANGISGGEYRSVSVDKLEYGTDGSIKQVAATDNGPAQIKNFNPYDTVLATTIYKQSGAIKTAICSAPNPGTISNSDKDSPGNAGDRCVMLVSIANNSWVSLKNVDFGTTGATKFAVRAASASTGGSIEIRTGSNTGTLAGTCNIGATGGITTWKDIECDISSPITGLKDLYLVFKGTTDQFRISKYIFKTSATTSSSSSAAPSSSSSATPPTCSLGGSTYVSGASVPRPTVTCAEGATASNAKFNVTGANDGGTPTSELNWNNNPPENHSFWNIGSGRVVRLYQVSCGSNVLNYGAASEKDGITCGNLNIMEPASPTCDDYLSEFCGDMAWEDVSGGSVEMPKTGDCLYIGDFDKIQPWLESTVVINGVSNTCKDDWGEENGNCPFNTKPEKKDGGYYVYVKDGDGINWFQNNGWQGISARPKPTCAAPSSILNSQFSINNSRITYYSIKGVPLGSVKPQKAGVYIVKEGASVKKIVVR